MAIPVIEKFVPRGEIKGSIGRKWAVDGVTRIEQPMTGINIEVYGTHDLVETVKRLASMHENGHAASMNDVIENRPNAAWDVISRYNRWVGEVEAWMRGLDGYTIDYVDSTFILDCMNSYRRGIPATEAQWDDFVDLLSSAYYGEPDDLFDYEPLEPDPGEKVRYCLPDFNEDDGRGDDEDGGGDRDEHDESPDQDNPFDNGWLEQDILDELANGTTIDEAAEKHGLDSNRLPPLIAAMRLSDMTEGKGGV